MARKGVQLTSYYTKKPKLFGFLKTVVIEQTIKSEPAPNVVKCFLNNEFFFPLDDMHSQSLDILVEEEGVGAEVGAVAVEVEQ